jgi:hypothetical protein
MGLNFESGKDGWLCYAQLFAEVDSQRRIMGGTYESFRKENVSSESSNEQHRPARYSLVWISFMTGLAGPGNIETVSRR